MRVLSFLVLVSFLIGCAKRSVSFHDDIQPILNKRCISCHGAEKPVGKIVLTSYEYLMSARTVHGKRPIVISGNAVESWLYLRSGTNQAHFRMPPDTSSVEPLSKNEVELIDKWIVQGANNN